MFYMTFNTPYFAKNMMFNTSQKKKVKVHKTYKFKFNNHNNCKALSLQSIKTYKSTNATFSNKAPQA